MMKFKLNLILQFVSYEMIIPRNMFLDHSPLFCPHMGFFINPLELTLLNKMLAERKNRHLVEMFLGGCYLSRLLFDQSYAVISLT